MGKSSGSDRKSARTQKLRYTDVISFEDFQKKTKSVRTFDRHQNTGSFRHTQIVGTTYYVYLDEKTFESMNPFTKKDQGKKYKSFRSGFSALDAKRQAYDWLKNNS